MIIKKINKPKTFKTNTAIMHDWFLSNSMGGGEKVTKLIYDILRNNSLDPDIFSIVSNLDYSKNNLFDNKKITTSFIQRLPFGRTHVQNYLPLLPYATEQIDLSNFNLIISTSHAFAKGILTYPGQLHISYIHTPMRYAWDQMMIYLQKSQLSKFGLEHLIRFILFQLRSWDYISAQRPDYLIANSNFTAKRIKK